MEKEPNKKRTIEPEKNIKKESNKRTKIEQEDCGKDFISQLPEELLILILSLVPSHQSPRTAVLSMLWRNLWKKSVKKMELGYDHAMLRELNINQMNVRSEDITYILSNCLLLEELRLINLQSFRDLTVTVSSKRLKKLEITECYGIRRLELVACSLVSFKYEGDITEIICSDITCLVEVSFGASNSYYLVLHRFESLESVLISQLETINLVVAIYSWESELYKWPRVESFRNLKKMNLDVIVRENMFPFSYVIWAFPFLEIFSLQMLTFEMNDKYEPGPAFVKLKYLHNHSIKEFHMEGFIGLQIDLEFIKYVVKYADSLKNVTVRLSHRLPQALSIVEEKKRIREYIMPLLNPRTQLAMP